MKNFYNLLLIFIFAGCEKSINIQPESQKPLLVVDGTIENGQRPFILLSNSLNYFSKIDPKILVASIVTNAKVTLSNGVTTTTLKEYHQSIGGLYELTYYSSDTSASSSSIIGETGKTYKLQIEYNDNQYTSVTTIPRVTKTLDSIWWKPAPHNSDTTKVVLMGKFTDPKGYGNYLRYFTKVNNNPYLPGAISVFDDQLTDGTTYDFQIDRGINRNDPPKQDEYGFFKKGDTVTVKFANIDKATFDFWRTLEFAYQSVGNPFSSPVKVLGNVSNEALGAFCGYGVQYKTLVIPK
ncbi:DUF4249 domain-containing protein [Segetibacter koreensis]|uniref:DUF4249 domain-containing protein n=1 Tax=Segetibacter koreensis TaxID=398037 RepID=UPI00037113A5|nr:DUF4249 domain-containing protein [Segetibacter koreensis]